MKQVNLSEDTIKAMVKAIEAYPVKEHYDGLQRYALVHEDVWNNISALIYQIHKELNYK